MQVKKAIGIGLATALTATGGYFGAAPDVVIDTGNGEIVFQTVTAFQNAKKAGVDEVLSAKVQKPSQAYTTAQLVLHEKGADYIRVRDDARLHIKAVFCDKTANNLQQDKFIIAQELLRVDKIKLKDFKGTTQELCTAIDKQLSL